jgi:regulator of protease activity HflC (stomatin/prohibitin superfamily)
MKKLIFLAVLILAIPLVFVLLMERVPPHTMGVKQGMWGSGIVEKDYPTGFHLGISGYHKWYLMSEKTHFLHFTGSSATSRSDVDDWNRPLSIRTTDGNTVTVELSIPYRIIPGMAHRIVQDGLQISYRERVKSKVLGVLRAELPQLTSEDWQITKIRLDRSRATLPALNEQLKEFYCEAESLLIRRFSFSPEYEKKLQEKQFLRQKANLDVALTEQAEVEMDTNIMERKIQAAEMEKTQIWEKLIQIAKSENEKVIATILAEAAVYSAKVRGTGEAERLISEANGQLALEKAEALRKQLRTAALDSEGGRILLGLEAAQNLQLPTVTLDSTDPAVPMILDLDRLVKLLVGTQL